MTRELVRLENVSVSLHEKKVLKDVNLSIYDQEFLGVIGPNGGGKTTLLKVILGLIKPDEGKIEVFGKKPEKGRKYIGYVPQHNLFDPQFPARVMDVVLMGLSGKKGFFQGYDEKDESAAFEAMEKVGIPDLSEKQISNLSGGQRQRVFIARALVSEPSLLLMDEPTTSVDKEMETGLYDLLDELKKEIGVVMVTHDISAVSVHVDKIACLNRKLYYHGDDEIEKATLDEAYQCPVELIAHGMPHRVLGKHEEGEKDA